MGAIGTMLPVLPTVPFLLLTGLLFAKGSDKLNVWFRKTKIYKNNLESYVAGQGMTLKTKVRIMVTITLSMGTGVIIMLFKDLYIPCAIVGVMWVSLIAYFCFAVKNYRP